MAKIIIVDHNLEALKRLKVTVPSVHIDGVSFLVEKMDCVDRAQWIIPAVPVHLAWEWVKVKMAGGLTIMPVPVRVERVLPNPTRGPEGQVFTSYADFVCPDNCRAPFDRCTFTGKPRKGLLYRTIAEGAIKGVCSVVIRSRQLAPGVGGYRPEDLEKSLERVRQCKSPIILFSTACLCHGVVHAIRLENEG